MLKLHAPLHTIEKSKQVGRYKPVLNMTDGSILANSKISQVYIQANYENDKVIQKVIRLVKETNTAVISRLPPPWREKFTSFSANEKVLLFMDNRLVIPKDMREKLLRAIHFGHTGREIMLREASDISWPKIHREIVEKAQICSECLKAGKNLKCMKTQKEFGKLPEAKEQNEEISIDFRGPFKTQTKIVFTRIGR